MGKRLLVLSASVGAGHMRAAQAVELALRELAPDAEVHNVDVLTLTNAVFRKLYSQAYLDLVNRAPHLLGMVYDLLDKPRKKNAADEFVRVTQKLNLGKLIDLLSDQPWDVVVNTHFLPAEILANLKKKGKLSTPQMTVTTDFDTHRLWVNQPCEKFTTATTEGAEYLTTYGVARDLITVTGIPIHPVFSKPADRADCRRKHGLASDRPVVLQLGGGFGVGPIESIYQGLLSLQTPVQVVAVAGKNEKVKQQLEQVLVPQRHSAKVIGFTTEIDQLMAAADVIVSKPGGLTTSEVLARGGCMAIVNPIPGQESRNSDYLLENGAAIKINNIATLAHKLDGLLNDPARLKTIRENALKLGRPRSAYDVAELALLLAKIPSTAVLR
jgi:processive 1,2-diacylglycerol beta-glucosyltransferase